MIPPSPPGKQPGIVTKQMLKVRSIPDGSTSLDKLAIQQAIEQLATSMA
jgi:hypothetical protein